MRKSIVAIAVAITVVATANGVNANVYPPTPTTTTTVAPSLNAVVPTTPPASGTGTVQEGGRTIQTSTQPTSNGVVLSGPGFSLSIQLGQGGQVSSGGFGPNQLPDGTLLLNQGGGFSTNGTGFQNNSMVQGWLLSTPVFLGTLPVNASGSFSGNLPLPSSIGAGRHTIQINGLTPGGQLRSVSIGVRVVKTTALTGTVLFDANSAAISLTALRSIERLAAQVAALTPLAASVQVLGYVQPVGSSSNDQVLSARRARSVARVLKGAGVQGVYDVRGLGRAKGTSPRARRVVITVVVTS